MHQIHTGLHIDLLIRDGGVSDTDIAQIGEVCRGIVFLFAELADEPHGLFQTGFQTALDVGIHDDGSAVEGWVKLIDEPVVSDMALAIHIHGHFHGNTAVVVLPQVCLHLGKIGILHLLPNTAIRVQVLDPADRQRIRGIRLHSFLHRLQVLVIPGICGDPFQKLLPGHLLVEQGELPVIEPDGITLQSQNIVELHVDADFITQTENILLLRFGRRVQLLLRGFHRLGQITIQVVHHGQTPLCQVSILTDDGIHGFPHEWQDEVVVTQGPCGFMTGGELRHTAAQDIGVQLGILISKLFLEIIEVVHDGFELVCDLTTLLSESLIPDIRGIAFLLTRGKEPVQIDQFFDPLGSCHPIDDIFLSLNTGTQIADADALATVFLPVTAAGNCIGMPTLTIQLLQKSRIFLGRLPLLELFINPIFTILYTAAVTENIVNSRLRQNKGFLLILLCQLDHSDLLFLGGKQHLVRSQPLVQEDHAVDPVCHLTPPAENLPLTGHVGPSPDVEHIVIGPVSGSLTILQDLLNKGVVKEGFNKIAAFSAVRVVGKECGDLDSVVFQGIAGAKQLVLLPVMVVELHIPQEVSVSSAQLQMSWLLTLSSALVRMEFICRTQAIWSVAFSSSVTPSDFAS